MHRFPLPTLPPALLIFALFAYSSQAGFHLWTISEVYSNASGSVQFIELVSAGPSETLSGGAEIRTDSGNVFALGAINLSGNTQDDRLLFATASFYSMPGAPTVSGSQPTYTIPADFFDPVSDRIRLFSPFFQEFHFRVINATSPIPTDNVFSRVYSGGTSTIAANSPQAREVTAGSINRGDYNGNLSVDAADFVQWRNTLTQAASPTGSGADGNDSGVIDAGDLALWRARFGNVIVTGLGTGSSHSAGVPEPAALALLAFGAGWCALARRRRTTG
jgi:hypothetical protein